MSKLEGAASRSEILELYRPVRASIQDVLAQAVAACRRADFQRAARHLCLEDDAQLEDPATVNMLCDVALFERNQRGRRVIDRFLQDGLGELSPAQAEVAGRLSSAFFSMFRVAGWHPTAGVWLEDLLKPGLRLWLLDEGVEASAAEGIVLGMRVFDAGPFYAGLGIVVQPDAQALAFCLVGRVARGGAAGAAFARCIALRRRDRPGGA